MFQRLGHAGMDDIADVGFVDAHAEGNGRDNCIDLFVDEAVLVGFSFFGVHSRVVSGDLETFLLKLGTQFIDVFTPDTVDDAGFAFVPVQNGADL